ncbi:MAG: LysR family transcriptional regulator [Noviherbaspirillum sp.]
MHIENLDLNLLRLFDAVYRMRNVSRAAEMLALSQPAASHGLSRLRTLLGDPLFARVAGGVKPTAKAERLALAIQSALALIDQALSDADSFDPASSTQVFRFHMSDIAEVRFLPDMMRSLSRAAPGVRVECHVVPQAQIAAALDAGSIDFAIGFLPAVTDTERAPLLIDRYVVLLRRDHPLAQKAGGKPPRLADLKKLDFVSVRSHSETLRILQVLRLEDRIRLTTSHFLALPSIVRDSNLGVVMPSTIAQQFCDQGGYAVAELKLPHRDLLVALHWSKRQDANPGHRWMREHVRGLFNPGKRLASGNPLPPAGKA